MDHVVTGEDSAVLAQLRRYGWPTAVLLISAALLLGAPGLLGWLPGALVGAPLALLAAAALFTLPGFALLRLFVPDALRPAEQFAAACALSCAAPPLLLLLADLVGLRWGPIFGWGWLALCGLIVVWPRPGTRALLLPAKPDLELTLLLIILGLALAARLYVVRDMPAGMFGDSYHHTVITQLLVEHGGLFHSWEPYAPLTTFTYHFGFHSLAAWLTWLSGYPVLLSVVAVGQVLGALAAPGVFLLASRLLCDRRAALWAAVAVGFVSFFPAYYVNWGRYTQLTGQTVLPATCLVWMLLIDRAVAPATDWRDLVRLGTLAALATVGSTLSHYRVAVFVAIFVLIYALYRLATHVRSWRSFGQLIGVGMLTSLAGMGLTVPWLLRIRDGQMLRMASYYLANNIGTDTGNDQSPVDLERALAHGLLAFAILGLVWIGAGRRWTGLLFPLWGALSWLAANPFLVGLNGAGIISSFTVVIGAYLVLGPLAGAGGAALFAGLTWLAARGAWLPLRRAVLPLELLAATGLVAWGLSFQTQIVDPSFVLLTTGDLTAAAWVREHVAPTEKVLVNSFPAYADTIYVGTDGGWWLAFLSGRRTNLDPISYGFEAAEQPGYMQIVLDRNRAMLTYPANTAAGVAALKAAGYAYLYDGPAANPTLEYVVPAQLDASPYYEQVYRRDGVTIWRVR